MQLFFKEKLMITKIVKQFMFLFLIINCAHSATKFFVEEVGSHILTKSSSFKPRIYSFRPPMLRSEFGGISKRTVSTLSCVFLYNQHQIFKPTVTHQRYYNLQQKRYFSQNSYDSLRADRLSKLLIEGLSRVEEAKNKDVIFTIGTTGAGKSTAIAYLVGAKMKKVKVNGKPSIEIDGDTNDYPIIGHSSKSETLYPQIYQSRIDTNYSFGDLPGFFDNSEIETKMAVSINTEHMIRAAHKRKIITIISYDQLTADRGEPFRKIAILLGKLFKDSTQINNSLIWGITKAPEDITEDDILAQIHEKKSFFRDLLGPKKEFEEHEILLNSIQKSNLYVINFLKDESRLKIYDGLGSIQDIPIQSFNFAQDDVRKGFEAYVNRIFKEGIELLKKQYLTNNYIDDLNKKINSLREIINIYENKSQYSPEHKNTRYVEWLEEEIHAEKERRQLNNAEIKRLLADLKSLDIADEILLHDELYEKTAIVKHRYNFSYFSKPFNIAVQPFKREIIECDKHGEIIDREIVPRSGKCIFKYKPKTGCDSRVKIQIFVEKNKKEENEIRIKQIREELDVLKKQDKDMSNTLTKLHKEIEESTLTSTDYNFKKQTALGEVQLKLNELEEKQKELLKIKQIIDEKQTIYSTVDKIAKTIPSYEQSALYIEFHDMLARRK
jgi:hypothetical protein